MKHLFINDDGEMVAADTSEQARAYYDGLCLPGLPGPDDWVQMDDAESVELTMDFGLEVRTAAEWARTARLAGRDRWPGATKPESWDRGFPATLRFPSVRAWERARTGGVFQRVPVVRCEVRGREPWLSTLQLDHDCGFPWRWFVRGSQPRSRADLPEDVYELLVGQNTDPAELPWQYRQGGGGPARFRDCDSACSAAWAAFAAAGRATEVRA